MGNEIALLCVAMGVCALVCLRAAAIGRWLGVLDHPDNSRKRHHRVTPQVGGVAVISSLMVWIVGACLSGVAVDMQLCIALMLCGVGVALVGFTDDQNGMSPLARLAFLVVFIFMVLALDHDLVVPRINSLMYSHGDIPLPLYIGLIVVSAVGIVNAVNMADGQDGVASGMFAIWSACLAYGTTGTSRLIAGVLFALCLGFMIFNLKPKGKVFLGDCGSYGISFIIGVLVILAHARAQIPIETIVVWFFIPVVDCLRLLVTRARRGTSPFRADRDHFHHRLEGRLGKTLGLVCYLGAVGVASAIATWAPQLAWVCLCVLTSIYFGMSSQLGAAKPATLASDLRSGNVVPITSDRSRGAA